MFTNLDIDKKLIEYWQENNLTESDFYCKECGKPLFDFSILEKIEFGGILRKDSSVPYLKYRNSKQRYIESEQERWAIIGRFLSGKHYQRKICWDCFFKLLPNLILEKQDEIKNKWMQKMRRNELNKIPVSWQSPGFYFTLIFDISEEDLKKEMDKFVTASPEFFKRKFGDNWKEEFEKYRKVQAKAGNTLEYFIEKYGKIEGKKKYEEVCANKGVTLKNCVRKYGEKYGKETFERYCKLQESAGNKLEYFIEKYGEEEGTKIYKDVCSKKAITLENMIRIHGEEKGKEAYKQWLSRNVERSPSFSYSKESQKLFTTLDECSDELKEKSKWETKNGEQIVIIESQEGIKSYRLDFLYKNKVIEFNGDYWHANPLFYNKEDIISWPIVKKIKVEEIWNKDKERYDNLRKKGYDVHIVWEHDYLINKRNTIKKCLEFLKS